MHNLRYFCRFGSNTAIFSGCNTPHNASRARQKMTKRMTGYTDTDNSGSRRAAGFTLMELLIVVAIVGILAAIAYPSYTDSVRKSRRAEAKTALSDLAARQEQYMTNNKTYASTLAQLGITSANTSPGSWYTLSIPTTGTPTGSATIISFTLQATPQRDQAQDAKCMSLTLTSTGVKSASGTQPTTCW